jgi:hypothetical protein
MKGLASVVMTVTLLGGAAGTLTSCSKSLACGAGTVEQNGECVKAGAAVQGCGDGGIVVGGSCYAALTCGMGTRYDPTSGLCVSTGMQVMGCSTQCEAPGTTTVCVTGTVKDFVSQAAITDPTQRAAVKVRIYDPIMFATNPNTPPLATTDVEDSGCYIAHDVMRPSSGFVAIAVDDAVPATNDLYVTIGVGAILRTGRNVNQLAWVVPHSVVDTWQADIGGPGNPPGCPNGLLNCGMWIGAYFAMNGTDVVSNIQPTRPGDTPPSTNLFCFSSRDHLSTTAKVTQPGVGLCLSSPDTVEQHGGVCTGNCTCGPNSTTQTPCTPTFTATLGGSSANVIFYQTFTSSTM